MIESVKELEHSSKRVSDVANKALDLAEKNGLTKGKEKL